MPIRSFKLKVKTKTGEEAEQLRKGLWRTHQLLNEGIAYYMNWLVLMRGQAIGSKSAVEIRMELLERVREQQRSNGFIGQPGEEGHILSLLRQLYELLIPSAVEQKGDSQMSSRKFLSPLVDPDSKGGMGVAKSGRKTRWLKLKEEGNPEWEKEYQKDLAKKSADPTSALLASLESLGLKPLIPLYTDLKNEIKWIPKQKGQFVRTWDRDMFQQAIERMLSWESWNKRVADEHSKLQQKLQELIEKGFSEEEDWVIGLRSFEQQRDIEFAQVSHASNDGYLITPRQVRGWDRVYEKWGKLKNCTDENALWEAVAKCQHEMRKGFGDPTLFRFLIKQDNHYIWKDHPESLYHFAAYNSLLRKLQRAKEEANFTPPDAIDHPLWVRYDARGGNLHDYIIFNEGKRLFVKFGLMLWPDGEGYIEKENTTAELAPSKQFSQQVKLVGNPSGKQEVSFCDFSSRNKNLEFKGALGGAKIQFDRTYIVNHRHNILSGEIGPVFLNLSVDVEPLQEIKNGRLKTQVGNSFRVFMSDWPKVIDYKAEELINLIKQSQKNILIGTESIKNGMRIMTIDLGQRTSAAASIFEVVVEKPDQEKFFIPINNTELFAVHRRSVLLNLPGENVSKKVWKARDARFKLFINIKRQVKLLSDILRLHRKQTFDERLKEIEIIIQRIEAIDDMMENVKKVWLQELVKLKSDVKFGQNEWEDMLTSIHRKLEPYVGSQVSAWRKSLSKERKWIYGLSMANIEELENNRELLRSWTKRTRKPGKASLVEKEEVFGTNQLEHIQNLKDDRLKQLANLIIMTALGYKYDQSQKKWIESYPACQAILFENLRSYRFNQERSRHENAKLMKWSHRSIPKMVYMQGELYGLQVGDVFSAYSSRFHAKTSAPGIRCHAVTEKDLEEKDLKKNKFKKELVSLYFLNEEQVDKLKPGHLVPRQGGELFVSLKVPLNASEQNPHKKLAIIHADINAAQNLQKRFWRQGTEIFFIPCLHVKTEDEEFLLPNSKAKAVIKQFDKGRFLKNTNFNSLPAYKWEKIGKRYSKSTVKKNDIEEIELEDLEEFEETLEEAEELKGTKVTLFRDLSGYFLSSNLWFPRKEFLGFVRANIEKTLKDIILQG